MFGSIQKENLSHRIIAAIKDHILKEKLKPGDRLATEREMAEAFDVSRSSVREAVKILEAIGVLESRPKHGISVRGFDPQAFFKYLSFGRPANRENILEMLDLRQVVDLGIADMVVERATEEGLAAMSKHIEGMRVSLKAPVEFYTHDWALHFAIYEATKNPSVQALCGRGRHPRRKGGPAPDDKRRTEELFCIPLDGIGSLAGRDNLDSSDGGRLPRTRPPGQTAGWSSTSTVMPVNS